MASRRLHWSVGVSLAVSFACAKRPLDRAVDHEKKGELLEAAAVYQQIAKADPANLAAWDKAVELYCTTLVRVNECMGVLDLELELLGQIDRHHDALAASLEQRARERASQGLPRAALQDLQRAVRVAPKRASLYAARARVYIALGEPTFAERAIKKAQELDPNNEEVPELIKLLPKEEGEKTDDEGFGGQ